MAEHKIQGLIRQLNRGDIAGELWMSKNIDLSTSPGKIKLARPVQQVMTDTSLSSDHVEAIEVYKGKINVLTDNRLYDASSPYTSFSEADTGPANAEDMVVFDGNLLITTNNNIDAWDGSSFDANWWTDNSGTALSANPHNLIVVRSGRDTLSVTDGNQIRYYNSVAGHTTISWDSELIAICQAAGVDRGWVGTYNTSGAQGEVFEWQVGNDQYSQAYPIGDRAALSIVTFKNTPLIVTERGEFKMFNGIDFDTIATFPMWHQPVFLNGVETGQIQSTNRARPIHPKGMRVKGDKVLVLLNSENVDGVNVNERTPSGVWELDPATGSLSHKYSLGFDTQIESSGSLFVLNDDNSRVYFGGELDPVSSSDTVGLWRENLTEDAANYGYFVTTEYHSDNVDDVWEKFVMSALQDTGHSSVVKYRTSRSLDLPIEADVTWTSSTTFNTTDDIASWAAVGDEVEILTDQGDGRCTHITAIESSDTVDIVTVEDAIGSENAVSRVRIDNWTKINDPYNTTDLVKDIGLDTVSPTIQFKVYMEGANGYPEISRTVANSTPKHTI